MHTAIAAVPIVQGRKEAVDAILSHAGQLILGGPNGSVVAYTLPQSQQQQEAGKQAGPSRGATLPLDRPAWAVRLSKTTRTVEQLRVIREANQLVSISDQTVCLHDFVAVQETGKAYAATASTNVLGNAPILPANVTTTLPQTKGALSLAIDTSIQTSPQDATAQQRGGAGYRYQAGPATLGRAYRPSDVTMGRRTGLATSSTLRGTTRGIGQMGMDEIRRDKEQRRRYMTMHGRTSTTTPASTAAQPNTGAADAAMSVVTTMAVGCRRKLLVFRWVDGAFWDTKEIHLPHTPRTLAFPTPTTLFIGYTPAEYAILTVPLAASSSVADLLNATPISEAVAIPSTSLAGTRVDLYEWKIKTLAIPLVGAAAMENGSATGEGGSTGSQTGQSVAANSTTTGMTAMAGAAFSGLTGYIGMATKNRPLVLQVDDGEVLVCRETLGVFLNEDGRPTRRDGIEWGVVPEEVLYVKPYVLSILPPPASKQLPATPLLQVRSASTLMTVQTLPFPPASELTVHSINAGNYPTVRNLTASTGEKPPLFVKVTPTERGALEKDGLSIWCLEMKSWSAQVDELVKAREYQEALALLNSIDELLLEDKEERRAQIESLYAVSLFAKGAYNEAIDHFLELDTNPARVIALYPAYIAGLLACDRSGWLEMFGETPSKAEQVGTEGASDVPDTASIRSAKSSTSTQPTRNDQRLRGLWGHRPQTGSTGKSDVSPLASSPAKATITAPTTPSSKTSTLEQAPPQAAPEQLPDATPPEPSEMPVPTDDERRAIDALGGFLADRRRIFKPILEQHPASHTMAKSQIRHDRQWLLSLPSKPFHTLDLDQLTAVAQTVDTALFKTFLLTKPGLLGPLCRVENWCEVDQVERLLMGRQRYAELIALYGGKEMHDKALQLLRKTSEGETDMEDKLGPTVRYLQNLGPDHIDLILRTSHWVLEQDATWGMEIFTADTGKVSSFPRFDIVRDLEAFDATQCIRYLQYLIDERHDQDPSLHEKLAYLLLEQAKTAAPDSDDRTRTTEALLRHLSSSHQYRADRVLHRVPSDDPALYDVRALLLGRLGRDEEALRIFVDRLQDHAKAEAYCGRIVAQTPGSDCFLTLLRIYLGDDQGLDKGGSAKEVQLAPALAIIQRHGGRIDARSALALLPSHVPLASLTTFANRSIRRTLAQRNEATMVMQVAKERALQVDERRMALHRRRVRITETRTCPRCMKRLGNSVIAVTSDGAVLHYGCARLNNNSG